MPVSPPEKGRSCPPVPSRKAAPHHDVENAITTGIVPRNREIARLLEDEIATLMRRRRVLGTAKSALDNSSTVAAARRVLEEFRAIGDPAITDEALAVIDTAAGGGGQ